MNDKARLMQEYRAALCTYLKCNQTSDLLAIRGMGNRMVLAGLPVLEFVVFHEHIIMGEVLLVLSISQRAAAIKRAAVFFSSALVTPRPSVRGSTQRIARLNHAAIAMLSQRAVESSLENAALKQNIYDCKAAEAALLASEQRNVLLLAKSHIQQGQMRSLSRDVLAAQENERKQISRELHDVIAQTLAGINVRLAALKQEAVLDARGIDHKIAYAQRLVSKAVDIVHRYARKLRPVALDDLGLIPALHIYLKRMRARTGLHIKLKACAEVEGLNLVKRTVLFRVAQEALIIVSRHAQAENVMVGISANSGGFCMEIQDDGRSFDPDQALSSLRRGHLGIIGMRERVEMVGGSFKIISAQGKGTLVIASLQSARGVKGRKAQLPLGGRQ